MENGLIVGVIHTINIYIFPLRHNTPTMIPTGSVGWVLCQRSSHFLDHYLRRNRRKNERPTKEVKE
jgi:hypothetical protein